ncbi:hypothetical protein DACRYDRAFT_108398 [Dacryopinax primogenitus]|uniref:DUF6533 domain-containing protein n=1 Tax=Dacryopinax primogenitus (strain DJM 731) TaxID=1858805 RepID=M5FTT1_DACPD|nr:uncharacterized protein DACRYDRAFT_108398 [Dacryopinax primogenitus]EJU01066.1 hypothetical protein DACRYDRAFT_108398 [Dacryopinax primogenitus]
MDMQQIITALVDVQISRYLSLSSYVALIYDLILTLPTEIALIWNGRWSIVKILFFIVRYTVPIVITINLVQLTGYSNFVSGNLSTAFCQRVILVLIYWQLIALAMVDVIVCLRICAIWQRRKSVFIILAFLWFVTYAITLSMTIWITKTAFNTIEYIPQINLCSAAPPEYLWTAWLPGVVFEGAVCTLTAIRTFQHWRYDGLPLKDALAQDGLIYFLFGFATRLFDLFIWGGVHTVTYWALLGEQFSFALTGIVCSRLLLNLRGVRTEKDWAEATDVLSVVSSPTGSQETHKSKSHKNEKSAPSHTLWVADTGVGLSFLEQIYEKVYNAELRPTFAYIDEYDGSP